MAKRAYKNRPPYTAGSQNFQQPQPAPAQNYQPPAAPQGPPQAAAPPAQQTWDYGGGAQSTSIAFDPEFGGIGQAQQGYGDYGYDGSFSGGGGAGGGEEQVSDEDYFYNMLKEELEKGPRDTTQAMEAMQGALGREQFGATRALMGQLGAGGFGASGAGAAMGGDIQRRYDMERMRQADQIQAQADRDHTQKLAAMFGLSQQERKLLGDLETQDLIKEIMDDQVDDSEPLPEGVKDAGMAPVEQSEDMISERDTLMEQVKHFAKMSGMSLEAAYNYLFGGG